MTVTEGNGERDRDEKPAMEDEVGSKDIGISTRNGSKDTMGEQEDTEEYESQHRCFDVKVFLVLMCLLSISQGFAVNGVNNVNIPMYEKRFGLTSTQTGLVASFYDIIAGCTVLLAGYYATQFHQPRLLAIASLCLAFGSLSMALPHFISGDYQPTITEHSLCQGNTTLDGKATCANVDKGLSSYLYMLLLGQGFNGLAGTVLYAIGPAFIDGSVSAKKSPVYLGLFFGSSALGPAIGYILGGYLLDIYVDTPGLAPEGLTIQSPAWVGAWWIGFLCSSASCLLIALPLFSFPKILPGTERRRRNNVSQTHDHGQQHKADRSGFGISIRDMPTSILLLLKNPVFVCECLIGAGEAFMLSGLTTFIPKFIANQFNQKASWSAMLTGFIAIPGAAIGQLLGGFLVQKFKMGVRNIIKFNIACSVGALCLVTVFWARCEQGSTAGVTVGYNSRAIIDVVSLDDRCNLGCGCDSSVYDPVCLQGLEYFTACHAGCSSEPAKRSLRDKTETVYTNCSCSAIRNDTGIEMEATLGKCGSKCMMLYVFIPVTFMALLCTFMITVPGTTIILRSVNDKQRTLAISMQQMCMRFLGSIPGPLVFGVILDNVCIVWQEKCEEQGSCWIYDTSLMGQRFYIIIVCAKVLTITLLIISFNLYKPPQKTSEVTEQLSDSKSEAGADGFVSADKELESNVTRL